MKHKTNHMMHFILTILTGGAWVWVWILVAVNNDSKNRRKDC